MSADISISDYMFQLLKSDTGGERGKGVGRKNQCLATHMHHYQENSPVLLYFIYVEYSTPSQLALAKGDEFQL